MKEKAKPTETLSDKRQLHPNERMGKKFIYPEEDVREAVKKLKEEIKEEMCYKSTCRLCSGHRFTLKLIDEIFGKELSNGK